MSRHYIEKADESLLAGDTLQASEKGWGAVAEAFKSIAAERGWRNGTHRLIIDAAIQLSEEWEQPDVWDFFATASMLHVNFYEGNMDFDEVARLVGRAKTLLAELDDLRRLPPKAPRITIEADRARWKRLTGEDLPVAPA